MHTNGKRFWLRRVWAALGPGIITGASDDDPSGIVTYAIAGAKGGFSLLWTAVITFPLMAAVQEMCARIGIVTSSGLAGVMRRRYPRALLWLLMLFVVSANTVNIGADLEGMAEAAALIVPLPPMVLGLLFAVGIVLFMIYLPYRRMARVMKWLTFTLFAYIAAAVVSHPDWRAILQATIFPKLVWDRNTVTLLVAILGTTISPYLFFWQASEEVEERREKSAFRVAHHIVTKNELKEMRDDVNLGMLFSNVVMFFIIVNAGVVFHARGITEFSTAGQVAQTLSPLAGRFAALLFTLGIVGTGILAIPVLAGSTAYVVAETLGFAEGLDKRFSEAKAFYGIIVLATMVGFSMSFAGISPVTALFVSAVIYGVLSPPLILILLDIANRREIMGQKINSVLQNILGVVTFVFCAAAVLALAALTLAR